MTFVVFLPSLGNRFVDFDDVRMFLENPDYRGLGWAQIRGAWTTVRLGEYMPLTWLSYSTDYVLWGLEPFGYHLSSLLLHTAAAVAVYFLARALLEVEWPRRGAGDELGLALAAGLAALVFAIHPLRAEPVAWVSARGTVLGGLLLLLSALTYVTASGRAGAGRIGWPRLEASAGLFALALLARATSLMLPVALLVLDVYPLRRLPGRPGRWLEPEVRHVWREKLPFLMLAALIVPAAFLARRVSGEPFRQELYDPATAIGVALFGGAFYLGKTLLPGGLAPVYELPLGVKALGERFLVGAVVVLGITLFLAFGRRRWPGGLAAWASYGVLLAPVSGLVPYGLLHLAADRYTYVACIGWAVLAGAGLGVGWRSWREGRVAGPAMVLVAGLALVVLSVWGALSWRQVGMWRDSKTLWAHAVVVTPRSAVAHNNLGVVLEREGDLAYALGHYQRAVDLWPAHAPFLANLGRALARQGRPAEAAPHLRRAIRLRPTAAEGYVALGVVLFVQGEADEAIRLYETALLIEPGSAPAHYNLGLALAQRGRVSEAADHYRRALQAEPGLVEARERLRALGGEADAAPGRGHR